MTGLSAGCGFVCVVSVSDSACMGMWMYSPHLFSRVYMVSDSTCVGIWMTYLMVYLVSDSTCVGICTTYLMVYLVSDSTCVGMWMRSPHMIVY